MRILVVEDKPNQADMVRFALTRAGFDVMIAHDLTTARRLFATTPPDLVVLDLNLGDEDGLDFLRELRQEGETSVILTTARDTEEDVIIGLNLGADDYVTKPFSNRELIARIRAVLRRASIPGSTPDPPATLLESGPIQLNPREHAVTRDGQRVHLTLTEFRLLQFLMSNDGSVMPTATILRHVWGFDDLGGTDVVRVTVHRVRRKLRDGAGGVRLLHTVTGVGIMFKVERTNGDGSS